MREVNSDGSGLMGGISEVRNGREENVKKGRREKGIRLKPAERKEKRKTGQENIESVSLSSLSSLAEDL